MLWFFDEEELMNWLTDIYDSQDVNLEIEDYQNNANQTSNG
jgi:hypothetical protein